MHESLNMGQNPALKDVGEMGTDTEAQETLTSSICRCYTGSSLNWADMFRGSQDSFRGGFPWNQHLAGNSEDVTLLDPVVGTIGS